MPKLNIDLSIVATASSESFDQVRFFLETLPEDQIPEDIRPHIKPVTDALAAITNDTDVIMTQEDYDAGVAKDRAKRAVPQHRAKPR